MKYYDTLNSYMEAAGERGLFNGCWMLKKDGKIVQSGAIGSRHPHHDLPIDTESLFDIASVSKQFTATAIMILRDRGQLSLDDTLDKYYPDTDYAKATIRQLMTHMSGLPDLTKWMSEYGEKHPNCTGEEVIDGLIESSHLPSQFEPGQIYCYCNTAFCVLARIVTKVTGVPFSQFLEDNIFKPAGMMETHVDFDMTEKPLDSNYAFGTVVEGGVVYPVEESEGEAYTVGLPHMDGDGSVVTSVSELILWDKALREETVISKETQEEMYQSGILPDGRETGYGYGWVIDKCQDGRRVISHTGRWAGYLSYFGRIPEEDSALAILCNQYGADVMAWIEMEDAFKAFLVGETHVSAPQLLDEMAQWDEDSMNTLAALRGEYTLEEEPITGLFNRDLRIYEGESGTRIYLEFMDTVFDSDLVLLKNGHYMERRGLFDFEMEDGCLATCMYDRKFTFRRN